MWIVHTIMDKTKKVISIWKADGDELHLQQSYCRLQFFVLYFGRQVLFQDGSLMFVRSKILHRVYFFQTSQ